jgi:hypothetical protein
VKRGRSTGKPTIAQQARHDAIREAGCIVAHKLGIGRIPCAVHHLTIGGKHGAKRRGHDFVLGLNDWSHQGYPIMGWSAEECRDKLGPSYAREPRAFREQIGYDHELEALQAQVLGEA